MQPFIVHSRSLSLLAILLSAACGAGPDDPDAYEDELAATEETDVLESAVTCDPRRMRTCNPTRVTPQQQRIWDKIASLPADVRAGYYASPLGDVATSGDGAATFQWYQGSLGRGTVHNVHEPHPVTYCPYGAGTFATYGGILQAWERGDFERGLGYPTEDRRGSEQSFRCSEYAPSPGNSGLVKGVVVISDTADGVGSWQERRSYQTGGGAYPGQASSQPQSCKYVRPFYCVNDLWAGYIQPVDISAPEGEILWCGAQNYDSVCPDSGPNP